MNLKNEILYFLGIDNDLNFNTINPDQNSTVKNVRTIGDKQPHDNIWFPEVNVDDHNPYFIKNSNKIVIHTDNILTNTIFFNMSTAINILLTSCSTFSRGLIIKSNDNVKHDFQNNYCSIISIDMIDSYISQHPIELLICLDSIDSYSYTKIINKFSPTCFASIDKIDTNDRFEYIYKCSSNLFIHSKELLSSFIQRSQLNQLDIYIISLRKSIKRRTRLLIDLDTAGLNYNIKFGIDGSLINISDTEYSTNIKKIEYANHTYFHDTSVRHEKLSYGEFGCAISHLEVYKNVLVSKRPALIFEDDAIIDDINTLLNQIRHLPHFNSWQLCLLQNDALWYSQRPIISINEYFGFNFKRGSNRTHCYILTPDGSNRLLQPSNNIFVNMPSDDYLSRSIESGLLTTISPFERVVSSKEDGKLSEIWNINKKDEIRKKHINIILNDISNGRLGNQMFIYAAGISMALKTGSFISIKSNPLITLNNVFKNTVWDDCKLGDNVKIIKETDDTFNSITNPECDILLDGYFQDTKFWLDKHIVKESFEIQDNIKNSAQNWCNKHIKHKIPISIHIRLSDNIKNDPTFIYTTWSVEDMNTAIQQMTNNIKNYSSDDYIWIINSSDLDECKILFKDIFQSSLLNYVFCDQSEAISFAIMKSCEYHIISASSYSWWTAYLSDYKYVIMPKVWYNQRINYVKNIDVKSLYISDWNTI